MIPKIEPNTRGCKKWSCRNWKTSRFHIYASSQEILHKRKNIGFIRWVLTKMITIYIYIHDSTYNYYGNFRGFAGKKPTEKKLRASRIFLALAASAIMAITTRLSFIMFGKEIGVGSRKHASASATTNALKEKRLLKVQAVTCVRACRV